MTSRMKYDQRKEIETAFQLFDLQKRGKIDLRELKAMSRALGFDFKKEEIRKIVIAAGKHPTELLSLHDTLRIFENRLPTRRTREESETLFKLLDVSGRGRIGVRELLQLAGELQDPLTAEEAQKMIESADTDGDGLLTFGEFYQVVKRRGEYPHDWCDFEGQETPDDLMLSLKSKDRSGSESD